MYTKEIYINTCRFLSCDYSSAVELILEGIIKNEKLVFSHFNLYNYYLINKHNLMTKRHSEKLQNFFEGIGLKSIYFLIGKGLNKDVNGTDLQPVLFKNLSDNGIAVFLLGADSIVIESAVTNIKKTFPFLQIKDYINGYFTFDEEMNVLNKINDSKSDLLIIGMGTLKEFEFINRNYDSLKVKAIWNVGGLFDFLSGSKPRAPKVLRLLRLEWLFRLLIEPRKKFIRIFYVPIWFIIHLLKINIFKNGKKIIISK